MKAHTEPLTLEALASLHASGERGTLLLVVPTIQPDWLKAATEYAVGKMGIGDDDPNLVEFALSNFLPAGTWYSAVS